MGRRASRPPLASYVIVTIDRDECGSLASLQNLFPDPIQDRDKQKRGKDSDMPTQNLEMFDF